MDATYFAAGATLSTIKAPAAITADGNSAGLDIRDYTGKLCLVLTALNTAGTTPTLAVKLQYSQDDDLIGTVTYAGTGNGTITEVWAGADAVAETITVTLSSATAFSVSGSVSGALGAGTVGTKFTSAQIEFLITAGGTAFVNTDAFTIPVTARTWADVTGASYAGLTTGASVQRLSVDADKLGRFIRTNHVIGGTVSPVYTVGIAMLGMKQYNG